MILILTLCISYTGANQFVLNEYSIKELAFDESFINKVLAILQGIGDNTTDKIDAVNDPSDDDNSTLTGDDEFDDNKAIEDAIHFRDSPKESTESREVPNGFIVPEFENVGQKRFRTVGHQAMDTKIITARDNIAKNKVAKNNTTDPLKLVTGFIADLFKIEPNATINENLPKN